MISEDAFISRIFMLNNNGKKADAFAKFFKDNLVKFIFSLRKNNEQNCYQILCIGGRGETRWLISVGFIWL